MNMTVAALAQRRSNVAAIAASRRAATHCKRDHEFTPENTMLLRNGRRACRRCAYDRRWYHAHGLVWKR